MIFSEYVNSEQWLAKVDARVKLSVTLAALIMILSYQGFAFQALITFICMCLWVAMKVPWRVIIVRYSEPFFIVLVILILKVFFTGEDTFFTIRIMGMNIEGHRDGLMEGLIIGSRIIAAISVVAVFFFSTALTELTAALSWFRMPKGFLEVLLYAYRYVFVLLEEAGVIFNAQKNRLGYTSFRLGLNSFGILAGSLVLKAFEHSQNITVAMVQRGYDGNMPLLQQKPFRSSEIVVSLLLITALAVAWKI